MAKNFDYESDRFCPVYEREIDSDLCYESIMCLKRMFTISSIPELQKVENIEQAREDCKNCPYSEM